MTRERKEPAIEISEICIGCGKPIAAIIVTEAFCCACRFGKDAWKDKPKHQPDCVEYMHGHMGDRLDSGFRRIKRHED
jgi:hypothetical protein